MRSRAAIEGLEAWGSFAHYDSIACDYYVPGQHGRMDAWTQRRYSALGVVDDGMGTSAPAAPDPPSATV